MTRLTFGLEWRLAIARPRLFVLNATIPLLLVIPIALSGAPTPHASAVYAVMFVLFGTFGSAIPLVRDSERGMVTRIGRTNIGAVPYLLGRTLAGTTIDAVQLAPALGIVLAISQGEPEAKALAVPVLLAVLAVTNLLGVWVAALARSLAEAALFSAVSGLMLLHASGAFRTPVSGSVGASLEAASPYRALHEILLSVGGAPVWQGGYQLLVWVSVLTLITVASAPRLMSTLASTRHR